MLVGQQKHCVRLRKLNCFGIFFIESSNVISFLQFFKFQAQRPSFPRPSSDAVKMLFYKIHKNKSALRGNINLSNRLEWIIWFTCIGMQQKQQQKSLLLLLLFVYPFLSE